MDRRPTDRTNNEQASSSASRSDSIRISKKASESIIAAAAPPPKRSRKAKNFSAPKNVIAVGGGKGGTGKSLLAANLGVVLSQQGRRVIMVDADLGGANLHTCLGMPTPKTTISDFISRRVGELSDIVIDTGIERLSLISGALDQMGAANPKYTQKLRFLREISRLDVDDVIIDLGGGTGFNVLDFFLIADHRILTVAPEPTAVENAYRFIKAIYYRRLKMAEFEWDLKALIQDVLEDKNARGLKTPADLVRLVGERDVQAAQRLSEEIEQYPLELVVNQTRQPEEEKLGESIREACRRYFGIPLNYLGHIPFDEAVWKSARRRRPLVLDYPESPASLQIREIASSLGSVSVED